MFLTHLAIKQLRNLTYLELAPSLTCNILYGDNGSGKTSLLEAIYYLSLSRSFRTSISTRVIQQGKDSLSVVGEIGSLEGQTVRIGVRRFINGHREMRLAGKQITTIAPLAQALPIQLINHQQQELLNAPKARRQYLDWGLFHVEQLFLPSWQAYRLALKQRNAGLRQQAASNQLAPWNAVLVEEAKKLDIMRKNYICCLQPIFSTLWHDLMGESSTLELSYHRGWSANKELEDILKENVYSDSRIGYTQLGAHKADLTLTVDKVPAKDKLSQGQQKLLVYALKLAQGKLLQQQQQKNCIYLIDDLPAELDSKKRAKIADALTMLNTQVFITGVSNKDLESFFSANSTRLFHVEQGTIIVDS